MGVGAADKLLSVPVWVLVLMVTRSVGMGVGIGVGVNVGVYVGAADVSLHLVSMSVWVSVLEFV